MRWLRRFRLTTLAVTVGLAALVLALSMVRAHWSEELTQATGAETQRLRTELASSRELLGQAADAAIQAERARQAAVREAGARRSEAARARKELAAAKAEIESIQSAKTRLKQEIAALHLDLKLATEAARQNLISMAEKTAALNAALDAAPTQEAPPPRRPEAQRDPVADQPATATAAWRW